MNTVANEVGASNRSAIAKSSLAPGRSPPSQQPAEDFVKRWRKLDADRHCQCWDHLAPHLKQRRQTATTEAKTPENALQDLKAQMRHVVSTVNEILDLLQEYPEPPEPDEKDWLVWQLSAHGEALVDNLDDAALAIMKARGPYCWNALNPDIDERGYFARRKKLHALERQLEGLTEELKVETYEYVDKRDSDRRMIDTISALIRITTVITLPFLPFTAAALAAADTLGIPAFVLARQLFVSPADAAKAARIRLLRSQCREALSRVGALREHLAGTLKEMEASASDVQVGHLASLLCELARARRAAEEVKARCSGKVIVVPMPAAGGSEAGDSSGVAGPASVGASKGFGIVVKSVKKVAEKLGTDVDGAPLLEGALADVDDVELATLEKRMDEWRHAL